MPEPAEKLRAPLFDAAEWRQILACLVLATLTLFGIALLFTRDAELAATLLASTGLHLIGSRAPAVLVCLARGLPPLWTVLFNFYIEALLVVLCYYSFVLVIREGVESKLLHLAAKRAEAAAQASTSRIKRFELLGLFLFVLAPFPATGPVAGAIAGYLLNIKPWVNFAVVLSGTLAALGAYALLGAEFLRGVIALREEYGPMISRVAAALVAVFVVLHVRSISRWVKELGDDAARGETP